jgi:2-phospho-L-lactate guanylyltransferase
MRTAAILPVKSFDQAKHRLSDGLASDLRQALAEAMFSDVLAALKATSVDEILVVTRSPAAADIAGRHGARVVEDAQTGHNAAAALAIDAALAGAAKRVLLVPGDCPALDPLELDELLARPVRPPSAVVMPDRHGTGTNGLLLTPPDALTPSFGPESCARHMALARARDTNAQVVELGSLLLDIDTPEDVELLSRTENTRPELAARTRQLLGQLSRC